MTPSNRARARKHAQDLVDTRSCDDPVFSVAKEFLAVEHKLTASRAREERAGITGFRRGYSTSIEILRRLSANGVYRTCLDTAVRELQGAANLVDALRETQDDSAALAEEDGK